MSKRSRSAQEQNKHDEEVRKIAREYKRKGYRVWADDIKGFSDPESVHGRVPDVVARRDGHITLVEVETPNSVDTKRDREQRSRFKSWTSRKTNRHFRRVIAE
jgi:hypothetical protein